MEEASKYTTERFDDNMKHNLQLDLSKSDIKLTVADKFELSASGQFNDYVVRKRKIYLGGHIRSLGYYKV